MGDDSPASDTSTVSSDAKPSGDGLPDRTGPSVCHVVHDRGSSQIHFDRETVEKLLEGGRFFWLDLDQPTENDFEILREVFKFHPLAVEDSEHFDQRAKLDDYDDFVFIVVYGAAPDEDQLVEVHCFYSERFLVTVHHDDCPAFAEIRRRYQKRAEKIEHPSLLLYRVVDGLVDSFFPILSAFDDRIDELEDAIFRKADDKQLQEIFGMKRLLVGMRKAVSPQRDTFASLMGGIAHETADHHRHDLLAAQLAHRLLRAELRLHGQAHRPLGNLRRPGDRHRTARTRGAPRLLQAPRLVLIGTGAVWAASRQSCLHACRSASGSETLSGRPIWGFAAGSSKYTQPTARSASSRRTPSVSGT